jgi:aryl-alcohol dehydrogenase-like predicted oxidoreductase
MLVGDVQSVGRVHTMAGSRNDSSNSTSGSNSSHGGTAPGTTMVLRPIGRSGESLPVIGLGTYGTFDVGVAPDDRAPLLEVLRGLHAAGGTVIDTSPMYGRSEGVLGDLVAELGLHGRFWLATKVWTRGREAGEQQIAASMHELGLQRLDLLQVHNLLDWQTHLPTLRALRESGTVRHLGVTHYRADAHAELERVLATGHFDFVQVNYSLAEREAEKRLLPFCRDRNIAVLVNRPFADGTMFGLVRDRALPAFVKDLGIANWSQYFLKWIVAHPAVTCVIPGTSKPLHLFDNCRAGLGPLPDAQQRARMAELW